MSNILICPPTSIASVSASRGTASFNLLRPDPKEVWLDDAVGTPALINVDFGKLVPINTIFLGNIAGPATDASWAITGGATGYTDTMIKASGLLRVPERPGRTSPFGHAFWYGADIYIRYLRLSILQPAGNDPISIGVLFAGLGWQPEYNQEWGAGRGVKDTGSVTRLPSGGFVVVEGARYATYKWTLGDLTPDETDWLHDFQMDRGESRRVLVVEDPDWTDGLRGRLHYGLLTGLRPNERRNPAQTRWDFQIENWLTEGHVMVDAMPLPVMTLNGEPISFGGEILTIGA